jgi:type VI protein secretion system component VasF
MSADEEARRHRLRGTFEEVPELYDAAGPLLGTASGHRAMPEAKREALYTRIRERIGDRKVSKTLQAILNVARRL